MGGEAPIVKVKRNGGVFEFECPYCWEYGGAYGSGDVDVTGSYRKRPKRAKAIRHSHGASEGRREAHCYNSGSPFKATGYVLVEERS